MHDRPQGPSTITELAYGVFPSFAMLAGMHLRLFTRLAPDGATHAELATALGTSEARLLPLVDLLVATGLVVRDGEQLRNSPEADTFLVEGRPEYRGGIAGFYEGLWKVALKTAESIRADAPAAKVDFAGFDPQQLMEFFRRQYPSSLIAGQELSAYADFGGYTHLADIGGGTGGTSIGLCTALPALRSTVYDLPSVAPVAQTFVSEAGMTDRIAVRTLDTARGAPEAEHDIALLRSVLQVLDEASARAAVRAAYALLHPGGQLLIVGSVLHDTREGPAPALARGLVFLNAYDAGQSYTESQHRTWLTDAGFVDIRLDDSCMRDGSSAVWARRPTE